jgi:hypothetical protein
MNRLAKRWPIGHLLLTTHLPFLLICWAVLVALAGLVLTAVAIFGTVRISTIDVGGQILRWLALGYGAHLTFTVLPIYLAHGQTRREFLLQAPVYQFVATGVLAGCTTIAYAGESLLYRANGWPQALAEDRIYNAASEYPLIFLSYWGMLMVWMLTGSFIGAGWPGRSPATCRCGPEPPDRIATVPATPVVAVPRDPLHRLARPRDADVPRTMRPGGHPCRSGAQTGWSSPAAAARSGRDAAKRGRAQLQPEVEPQPSQT